MLDLSVNLKVFIKSFLYSVPENSEACGSVDL